jgi:hypothetical protein
MKSFRSRSFAVLRQGFDCKPEAMALSKQGDLKGLMVTGERPEQAGKQLISSKPASCKLTS